MNGVMKWKEPALYVTPSEKRIQNRHTFHHLVKQPQERKHAGDYISFYQKIRFDQK